MNQHTITIKMIPQTPPDNPHNPHKLNPPHVHPHTHRYGQRHNIRAK